MHAIIHNSHDHFANWIVHWYHWLVYCLICFDSFLTVCVRCASQSTLRLDWRIGCSDR